MRRRWKRCIQPLEQRSHHEAFCELEHELSTVMNLENGRRDGQAGHGQAVDKYGTIAATEGFIHIGVTEMQT